MSRWRGALWLMPLAVYVVAGCAMPETAPTPTPVGPSDDERQALAAYENFWSVADAALAAPGSMDWTAQVDEVATGQARDSLLRDVDNYASLPAHTEGAVTRAPRISGTTAGRIEVLDCVNLGDSRLVSDTDRKVLDDLANRVPRYVYRAGLVNENGRWRVDRTSPALGEPC